MNRYLSIAALSAMLVTTQSALAADPQPVPTPAQYQSQIASDQILIGSLRAEREGLENNLAQLLAQNAALQKEIAETKKPVAAPAPKKD